MTKNQILTHRGLEPSKSNFYSESSFEAFEDHLRRGFGIEFDVNFTKDGIIIFHDLSLKRLTNGRDKRSFDDLTTNEVTQIKLKNGRLCTLDELIKLIKNSQSIINALHLKGNFQEQKYLNRLIKVLTKYSDVTDRILIFDVKPETAKYLKEKILNLHLAPSVSHPFDIERYNQVADGTLMALDEAIKYKKEGLYDWVWLDEWDRIDKDGKDKTFYNQGTFEKIRNVGYKIALVTPELHGISPGLLGGEAHPDAMSKEKLFRRTKEIISLNPDLICTDYPEEVYSL